MGLKSQVEELCKKAIKESTSLIIKLPRTPSSYTQHMIDERFFQLYHLVKRNGCDINKINLTDYKISQSLEKYTPPKKKAKPRSLTGE